MPPFLGTPVAFRCVLPSSLMRCSARSAPVARSDDEGLFQLVAPVPLGPDLPEGAPLPLPWAWASCPYKRSANTDTMAGTMRRITSTSCEGSDPKRSKLNATSVISTQYQSGNTESGTMANGRKRRKLSSYCDPPANAALTTLNRQCSSRRQTATALDLGSRNRRNRREGRQLSMTAMLAFDRG